MDLKMRQETIDSKESWPNGSRKRPRHLSATDPLFDRTQTSRDALQEPSSLSRQYSSRSLKVALQKADILRANLKAAEHAFRDLSDDHFASKVPAEARDVRLKDGKNSTYHDGDTVCYGMVSVHICIP